MILTLNIFVLFSSFELFFHLNFSNMSRQSLKQNNDQQWKEKQQLSEQSEQLLQQLAEERSDLDVYRILESPEFVRQLEIMHSGLISSPLNIAFPTSPISHSCHDANVKRSTYLSPMKLLSVIPSWWPSQPPEEQVLRPITPITITKPPPRQEPNNFPDRIWSQLLAPMDLLSGIRLEHTCQVFVRTIFSGQQRLVWDKRFRDYLYSRMRSWERIQQQWFLVQFAKKIGTNGRQLIIKTDIVPRNHRVILGRLPKLESVKLKLLFWSEEFVKLFGNQTISISKKKQKLLQQQGQVQEQSKVFPSVPTSLPLEEMTFFVCDWVQQFPDGNYLPESFPQFMNIWGSKLVSFEVWRSESQYQEAILKMPKLTIFSLYCDDSKLRFFGDFANVYYYTLVELYIEWESPNLTPKKILFFFQVLSIMRSLRILQLTMNLNCRFTSPRIDNLLKNWKNGLKNINSIPLEQLTINILHTNFAFPGISSSKIIADITKVFLKLKYLHLIITDMGTLPLSLTGTIVDTLEISFRYMKECFLVWDVIYPSSLYPTKIFKIFEMGNFVRALKLIHCPPWTRKLANHLAIIFSSLEMLFISISLPTLSNFETSILFNSASNRFTQLRVFQLRRKMHSKIYSGTKKGCFNNSTTYRKVDLKTLKKVHIDLLKSFQHKAIENSQKQFVIDIDNIELYLDLEVLLDSIRLPNYRIYLTPSSFDLIM